MGHKKIRMDSRKFPFDAHLLCVDKNGFDVSGDMNIMKIDMIFMVRSFV